MNFQKSNIGSPTRIKTDDEDNCIRARCMRHPGQPVTHGCSSIGCKDDIIFCSQCLLENLDHVKSHKNSIFQLGGFIREFYKNMSNSLNHMKQFLDLEKDSDNHLLWFNCQIRLQKQYIEDEIKSVAQEFDRMLQQIKKTAFSQLDQEEQILSDTYSQLKNTVQQQDIKSIIFESKQQFTQKLNNCSQDKLISYLSRIREYINVQQEPSYSGVFRTLENHAQQIQQYRSPFDKATTFDLKEICRPNIQYMYADCNEKISRYIEHQIQRRNKLKATLANNQTDDQIIIKYDGTHQEIQNPLFQHNKNKIQKLPQKFYLLQDNQFFGALKYDIQFENLVEQNHDMSCLVTMQLCEDIIVCAGKENLIRILKISRNEVNQSLEITLKSIYQDLENHASIWSLSNLFSVQQEYNLFASGTENGKIYIWKYINSEQQQPNLNRKPYSILNGEQFCDIISYILDLENGQHLVSGDSNGTLMVWNYHSGKPIYKSNLHRGQINTMTMYNDKRCFAVGAYDGQISLWEVQHTSQLDNIAIEIQSLKAVSNSHYIYNLIPVENNNLLVVDGRRILQVLNTKTYQFIREGRQLQNHEQIMDVLTVLKPKDYSQNMEQYPYLMCFTKNYMVLTEGRNLEPIQVFDSDILINSNIGLTMNSCHKVIALNGPIFNDGLYFAIVDQNDANSRMLTIFKMFH